jgi:hypothetical protein
MAQAIRLTVRVGEDVPVVEALAVLQVRALDLAVAAGSGRTEESEHLSGVQDDTGARHRFPHLQPR